MIGRGLHTGTLLAFVGAAFLIPSFAFAIVGWPVNLTIVGGMYTKDTTPTFTWGAAGGATWYDYKIDNNSYVGVGNVRSVTVSSLHDGWHTFYLRGHNNAGEIGQVKSVTFEVDTTGPTVPAVSPSTAIEDRVTALSVTPSGEASTVSCTLHVSGSSVGSMSKSGTTFTKTYTFTRDGSYTTYAVCTDGDGNTTSGTHRTVMVYEEDEAPVYEDDEETEAEEGELIKSECHGYVEMNDPCTAVYYWGQDGKRHPFPNEDVFFSWYNDFDDVKEIDADEMADIPMGETVTLKPGVAVVRFDSSDKVYAVAEGGILRHYLTPSLVAADYGSDWVDKDLVTLSDSFFSDYFIGQDIDSSTDYDPETAEEGVTSIDDNF